MAPDWGDQIVSDRLRDPRLFGNDAAEDENPAVLASYFVNLPESRGFGDPRERFLIARGKKGIGKSAFLVFAAHRLSQADPAPLVITLRGSDLVGPETAPAGHAAEAVRNWKVQICTRINAEIGRQIGLALDDTKMTLVEQSELLGFKGRNFFRALMDRLKVKGVPMELRDREAAQQHPLLKRYMKEDQDAAIWVFMDDIDGTFRRSDEECLRLSTFFTACRELASEMSGLTLRTTIRRDVWATIRTTDEALDKCEQYMRDIKWSRSGIRELLAHRIRSYVNAQTSDHAPSFEGGPDDTIDEVAARYRLSEALHDDKVLRILFRKLRVAGGSRMPHDAVFTYSGGSPRAALQLCKLAAQEASSVGASVIRAGTIDSVLEAFGRKRIEDLLREYGHQTDDLAALLYAFGGRRAAYSTAELLACLEKSILPDAPLAFTGSAKGQVGPLDAAHYLFQIGFLFGRDRPAKGGPNHYAFDEKPYLLKNAANLDEGLDWLIHPAFHKALRLS